MMDVLVDYLTLFLLLSMALFGWAIAWFCWHRGDRMIGAAVLIVWLALVARSYFLFILLRYIFGENFIEQSSFGIIGNFLTDIGDALTSSMVLFVLIIIAYIPYALFKKRFGYAAIAFLLIFPASISHLESYFLFYPLIDTTKSSIFTLKRFDMIRPGMTREQVRILIGNPVENAGQYDAPCEGQTGDGASAPYYDFAWLNSSVCYDESDRVTETKKMWVPD